MFFFIHSSLKASEFFFDHFQSSIYSLQIFVQQNRLAFNRLFKADKIENQQILASHEDNTAQLYNNAIASMVFMIHGDYQRAEAIFNYFNGRMDDTEFTVNGVASGFYQKRDSTTGLPDTSTDRWFGDNAFLLMALNYYKKTTGNTIYDSMANDIAIWFISLQNADGSVGNGHTEGNLDVYAALKEHGNTTEAEKIKTWLESAPNQNWKNGPLDIHSWRVLSLGSDYGFCLNKTQNHKRTIDSNGSDITGFVGAINRSNNIWGEGTGQMILAFYIAGYKSYGDYYLQELKKTIIKSNEPSNVNTLPFLVLSDPIDNWSDPTKGHVASVAWYLFALKHFNPFSGETVTTYDKPNAILRIQAENYDSASGDVRLDSTGNPLEGSAIHLAGDDNISCPNTTCSNTADYTFFTLDSIPAAKISVRYADDVGGEICNIYIDGQLKYTFTSIDTGAWEDYIDTTPFDIGSIAAGNHTLQIVCEDKGTWGVTVDAVNISQ